MIETVASTYHQILMYGAIPLISLVGFWVIFYLRAPQFRQLGSAFRSLAESNGTSLGVVLSSVGMLGAAASVGVATAIGLGGPGVLLWVWLFALLISGLHIVETWLSRTDVPGQSRLAETGSLSRRLMLESGPRRALGMLLTVCLLATGFAFVGSQQAPALSDGLNTFFDIPDRNILFAIMFGAALLAAFGRTTAHWIGWLGFAAMVLVAVVCVWLIAGHPAESFTALSRAVSQGLDGAPSAPPFVGAAVGEVATLAIIYVLVHLGAPLGIVGSLQRTAAGTRKQAGAVVTASLAFALITTLLCMACVGTEAFRTPTEGTRPISELTFLKIGFETASQRAEVDRLHTGYVRVRQGISMEQKMVVSTMQGSIEEPRFDYYGKTADLAFMTKEGKITRIMRVHRRGNLMDLPFSQLKHVTVRGTMLPNGATMLKSAAWLGTGSHAASFMLGLGLLILGILAIVVWGWGLHDALPAGLPPLLPKLAAMLPALGVVIAALVNSSVFSQIGGWAVGITMILAALSIAWLTKEVSVLDTSK